MYKPFKAVVVGLGNIGWAHASDIVKTKGLELTGLCETNEQLAKRAENEFKIPVFLSYDELLKKNDADFIVISTPSHMHAHMASEALQKGFNVLIEKPVAPNVTGAIKIKELADKNGLWASVNQSFRYRPDVLWIKDIIKSGIIGNVYRFSIHALGSFKERRDWQIWTKFGGGALANWGVHLVDAILFILEENPFEVFAQLDKIVDKGDTEDAFTIVFKLKNGCMAEVESMKSFFNSPYWYICGTKGSIIGEFAAPVMNLKIQYITDGKAESKTQSFDFSQSRYISQIFPHYAELVKNLNDGKKPPVTIESVIKTMSILDAARKSNDKKSSIKIGELL